MSTNLDENYKSAWVGIIYSYGAISRKVNRELRGRGLVGLEAYDALLVLEEADEQTLDISALSERLLVSLSGASRLIGRLIEKGYVVSQRSSENHRQKMVSLTPSGLSARQEAWATYSELLQREFEGVLTAEEAGKVGRILARFR